MIFNISKSKITEVSELIIGINSILHTHCIIIFKILLIFYLTHLIGGSSGNLSTSFVVMFQITTTPFS